MRLLNTNMKSYMGNPATLCYVSVRFHHEANHSLIKSLYAG